VYVYFSLILLYNTKIMAIFRYIRCIISVECNDDDNCLCSLSVCPESVEVHLVHCHDWIKLVSSQLFNELFSSCSVNYLVSSYLQSRVNPLKSCNINGRNVSLNASNYLTQNLWEKVSEQFIFISLSLAFSLRSTQCYNTS